MTLRLGLSGDFLRDDGTPAFADMGIAEVDLNGAEWDYILPTSSPAQPDELDRYDGIVLLSPRVTAESLAGIERLRILARFGVGYESVDVAACTRAGIVLTITPDGVRRPVAAAATTLLLALAHQLLVKDRLTRDGRWSERTAHHGSGLVGRTLGIIGLGNIGREVARLAAPFDMRIVAADPLLTADRAVPGVELVDLDQLLVEADFLCISCPLTTETYHLLNAERLARMKPSAFLINVARGPIVDQIALVEALKSGRIRGAGLDVFETEPIPPDDPLLALENVIVSPHSLSWTDQMFRETGRSAVQSVVDLFERKVPRHIVNREVLEHPRVRDWLAGSP